MIGAIKKEQRDMTILNEGRAGGEPDRILGKPLRKWPLRPELNRTDKLDVFRLSVIPLHRN